MNKFLVITKKQLQLVGIAVVIVIAATVYITIKQDHPAEGAVIPVDGERVIHMVTGEYKTKTADGKEIEVYTWHPGTIFVEKGEAVQLSFYGVNGGSHPFIIEGTDIKGEVRKGKETIVRFQTDTEGTYRIVCLTHPEHGEVAPMIGYIVVD